MDQRLPEAAEAVPPDWRGLCEELIEALETAGHRLRVIAPEAEQVLTWTGDAFAAAARASALLDQPEPEVVGPSLEEVEDLCEEHCFNVEGYESIECLQELINDAIARYGHQPAPPAEDDCPACEGVSKPGNQPCAVCGRPALAAEADGPAVPEGREPAAVTVEPSDGDLLQLMPEQFRADLGTVSRMAAHGAGPDIKPGLFRVSLNTGVLEYARAILARWGRPAPAPAGERQAAPVPVAVSERLPGAEDCNGDEEVWAWRPFDSESDMDGGDFWSLAFHEWLEDEDCGFTHWLPARALPLPNGEAKA